MRRRLTLVFWIKCLLAVAVLLGVAGAVRSIRGGPMLAHDKLVRTGDAMEQTWKYRVRIDYALPGGEFQNVATVAVNNPEDYLVTFYSENAISEVLAVQERVYTRTRRFVVEEGSWSEPQPRGLTMYPSLGPLFFPAMAIQGTYAAFEATEVGPDTVDGVPMVHFRGKVNPAYAYQRAYATWLVRTRRARPIKEGSLGTSPPTLAWVEQHAPALRGRLDTQVEAMSFFVRHPATIDIWAHAKDRVAYLVQITMPDEAAAAGLPAGIIRFRFMDFNHDFDVSPFPRFPVPPDPTVVPK